jgi:hypothetical protein
MVPFPEGARDFLFFYRFQNGCRSYPTSWAVEAFSSGGESGRSLKLFISTKCQRYIRTSLCLTKHKNCFTFIVNKNGVRVWFGLIWLRIGTSDGGPVNTGFYKMRGIS